MVASYTPKIAEALQNDKFSSVLEFACGDGQNLQAIKDSFPEVIIDGFDIDPKNNYKFWNLMNPPYPYKSKSFDVVLIAATLLLFGDRDVKLILKETKRIAKKMILLVERHREDGEIVETTYNRENRIHHNYKRFFLNLEIVSDAGKWNGDIIKITL